MISRRAAGVALAVLGIAHGAAMIWLVGLLGTVDGADRLVVVTVRVCSGAAIVVGCVHLIVLGAGARPRSSGLAILATGAAGALGLVAVIMLAIAWRQGASNVLVGVLAVPLTSVILVLAGRSTLKYMVLIHQAPGS